jgi:hypothetical protein
MNAPLPRFLAGLYAASLLSGAVIAASHIKNATPTSGPGTSVDLGFDTSGSPGALLLTESASKAPFQSSVSVTPVTPVVAGKTFTAIG